MIWYIPIVFTCAFDVALCDEDHHVRQIASPPQPSLHACMAENMEAVARNADATPHEGEYNKLVCRLKDDEK